MFSKAQFLENLLLALLLVFISSLLLVLGSDQVDHIRIRLIFGGCLLILSAVFLRGRLKAASKSLSFWIFTLMMIFLSVRAVWGVFQLSHLPAEAVLSHDLYSRYVHAPFFWFFYYFFFALSYVFFEAKFKINALLETLGWTTGFMAFNGLPSLFQHPGKAYYVLPDMSTGFYYPIFYFHPWVKKYVLGTFAHPNYSGDVLAFGFFAMIGLVMYALFQRFMRSGDEPENSKHAMAYIFQRMVLAVVIVLAVFLFFSRGTMATFLAALAIFFLLLLIKVPSRFSGITVAGMGVLIFVCLAWGGNLKGAWKELQTLNTEQEALKKDESSFALAENQSIRYVREGVRRCRLIYKAYPVWGAGSRGYREIALHYADPEQGMTAPLLNLQSLCFYMQMLAEEGKGAFIYFIFLAAYALEIGVGMYRTQSRFKFIAALSLFASILMILLHASFNQLMDQFSMLLLTAILMGANLAVLRQDFKRE